MSNINTQLSQERKVLNIKKKKVALICAGGGISGGVYEIGCLKALEDYLMNRSITDFDIYIGTSVGSIIATSIANGITPSELFKSLISTSKMLRSVKRSDLYNINYSEIISKLLSAPGKITKTLIRYLSNKYDQGLTDLLIDYVSEMIPSAPFTTDGIEAYIKDNFMRAGMSDDFHELRKELYITACDLDSGDRIIFGENGTRNIPISLAVKASCALPPLYKPVRIGNRDYVDGAIRRLFHLDIAKKHGADLAICLNPIVPYRNDIEKKNLPLTDGSCAYIKEKGMPKLVDQVLRTLIHSRANIGIEKVVRENPDLDIIIFEPSQDDITMFSYNLMSYSARIKLAEHGFNSVREKLLFNHEFFKNIFAKHGIEVSNKLIEEEYTEMQDNRFSLPSIIRNLSHRKNR